MNRKRQLRPGTTGKCLDGPNEWILEIMKENEKFMETYKEQMMIGWWDTG